MRGMCRGRSSVRAGRVLGAELFREADVPHPVSAVDTMRSANTVDNILFIDNIDSILQSGRRVHTLDRHEIVL